MLVEYNSGKTEVVFNEQANNQELQKVISYYKNNNQINLSQQDLINAANSNSVPTKTPNNNNTILIGCGLGGLLISGVVIGLVMKKNKNKVKKNRLSGQF